MRASSGYIFATAILLLACSFLFAKAQGTGSPDKPRSRADWPTERVTVVGKRGSVRDWLVNHTFRGTEGFADGSAPADVGSRFEYYFQIYYMADGRLEAHYQRPASRVPHGPIEALGFVVVADTPAAMERTIREDAARWSAVIRELGITLD